MTVLAHPVAQFAVVVGFLVSVVLVEAVRAWRGDPITARRPCRVCGSVYCRHRRRFG